MCIVFHQIFYADPIIQFTAKLDEQSFGVWVKYFISLHYEMFIIDNVAIKMSVYQINKCEHSGVFIIFVVLSQKVMTCSDFFISFSKNKDWGFDALSLLNF